MASNYNRKSASSGSHRRAQAPRGGSRPPRGPQRPYNPAPGARLTSVRVGDLPQRDHGSRARRTYQRYLVRLGALAAAVAALAIAAVIVYNSSLFTIESVSVSGADHLTASDMQQLAGVPAGTTLLRVDAAGIKENLKKDAWVADAKIKRVFPNTLQIDITERTITAVVEVPNENAQNSTQWAIASDGMWLMPIPDRDSEAGRRTNSKV